MRAGKHGSTFIYLLLWSFRHIKIIFGSSQPFMCIKVMSNSWNLEKRSLKTTHHFPKYWKITQVQFFDNFIAPAVISHPNYGSDFIWNWKSFTKYILYNLVWNSFFRWKSFVHCFPCDRWSVLKRINCYYLFSE